ncbi:MAG: aldose 1-epimerase, partial [Thermoleophilaceae bacterium]|nr:aldose 1-epimerase [Thermoleophilaceae bacterium]
ELVRLTSPSGVTASYAPGAGMVGCSLTHDGDELLAQRKGLKPYAESGSTFGIPLLHPWANRLDTDVDSPLVRRDPNGLAIHGVVPSALDWRVAATGADEHVARLEAVLDYTSDELLAVFPHPHELTMEVWLAAGTLTVQTTLRATHDAPVPVAFGYHPYLRMPGAARADWRVELPVRTHLLLDDRMLPTGAAEPANEPLQRLGERGFDDAYADLDRPAVFVLEGGGRRIELSFTDGYEFAQVYAPPQDEFVCFEPMTAPTNALKTRPEGLREVEPGEAFSAAFEIRIGRL